MVDVLLANNVQACLDDYQLCGLTAWYHLMALAMLAGLFLLKERIAQFDEHPSSSYALEAQRIAQLVGCSRR